MRKTVATQVFRSAAAAGRAVRHRLAKTGQATLDARQLEGWTAFEAMIRMGAERSASHAALPVSRP